MFLFLGRHSSIVVSKLILLHCFYYQFLQLCISMFDPQSVPITLAPAEFPPVWNTYSIQQTLWKFSLLGCHCQKSQGSIQADKPCLHPTGTVEVSARMVLYLPSVPFTCTRSSMQHLLLSTAEATSSVLLMQYKTYNLLKIRKFGVIPLIIQSIQAFRKWLEKHCGYGKSIVGTKELFLYLE